MVLKQFDFPDGATPIEDVSGLIPRWVQTMEDLNRAEAENIYRAQKKYLMGLKRAPKSWFQLKELKSIHSAMFCEVWEWAGVYRRSTTSIGIKPFLIPSHLSELCREIEHSQKLSESGDPIKQAALVHHKLVWIHPFENGNGRFSRLVADRFLLSLGWRHPIWPSNLQSQSRSRAIYIESLQAADRGDYDPLIQLMIDFGAKKH